jgi:hypothetical protein
MPDLRSELMRCVGEPDTWPAIAADLRRALAAAGRPAWVVEATVANLAPVFAAVERARTSVDDATVFALLSLAADRARRHEARRAWATR